ncbi:MAG TPA: YfhO family protein [Candidatus Eisenbergiella intestinipullorum]|nr:YfhO family protein [Candidatus Eisenbergiella intestinipullorum]
MEGKMKEKALLKKEEGPKKGQKMTGRERLKKIGESGYIQVFLLAYLTAMLSFLLLLIRGDGVFTLGNDFNEQQIPFHMLVNRALKSGNTGWNWSIDLGSGLVGAFGFYVLGSPFAWISFLFPAESYPYVTAWLYMAKYAAAGTCAYGYLKRFTGKRYAALGALLYAFCGFQSVNLIFHHFHDAVAFFPLMLSGYEELREGKKGRLAPAVAVNALVNYYFLIQEVIFLVLYFLVREGGHLWKKRKLAARCMLEGVLGIAMGGVLFVPSVLFTMENPRLSNHLPLSDWIYRGNRDYLQVIRTLLFPGELMNAQSCIKEYDWSSWSAYLPMTGLSLPLCYILKRKKDWLSVLMAGGMLVTAIPALNCVFGLFSDTNYHRWLFMLILLMSLASAKVLEKREEYPVKSVCAALSLFMLALTLGSFWWSEHKYQLINQREVFLTWSAAGIAGVALTGLLTAAVRNRKAYAACMGAGILFFSIFTTGTTAWLYQHNSGQSPQEYEDRLEAFRQLSLPDSRYRIAGSDNTLFMANALPGTGSFTSMVDGSIYEFYEALGTSRPVFSPEGPAGTRELLGGKYCVTPEPEEGTRILQEVSSGEKRFFLCEYEHAAPIGSLYETYMTREDFQAVPEELRAAAMLRCLVIPEEYEKEAAQVLERYDPALDGALSAEQEELDALTAERERNGIKTLDKDPGGFTATLAADRGGYAFFSVPYDRGFHAQVNGKAAQILKTNGMMAVLVEPGENRIRFSYRNDDLTAGAVCTIAGFLLWGLSLSAEARKKRSR